jgi:hypothetical protein
MRLTTVGVMVLALATVQPGFAAQGRGRGKKTQAEEQNEQSSHAAVVIGQTDQRIIREWFAQPSNLKGLPPGLAKKESLPPGLQKQLVRNGQLPPGLQKKIQPMPAALEEKLSPVPEGTKRVVINGSIVLFNAHTNLVLDIMAAF